MAGWASSQDNQVPGWFPGQQAMTIPIPFPRKVQKVQSPHSPRPRAADQNAPWDSLSSPGNKVSVFLFSAPPSLTPSDIQQTHDRDLDHG